MAITIKCPDCGHTKQSEDGDEETCPECEGTMAPPPKKKYQAKTKSLEEESKGKKKSKPRDDDDDEDEKPKKKTKSRDDDDEDEDEKPKAKKKKPRDKGDGDFERDGKAAASLDINPGFKNKELMAQVGEELSNGEVLHWAGRMCPELAKRQGMIARIFGIVFAGFGLLACLIVVAIAPGMMKLVALFPLLFVGIGLAVAVFAPKMAAKGAARGWYAVTDQRAIVYTPSVFGSGGKATTYDPDELNRMRVKGSSQVDGAGDLIFKTVIQTVVHSTGKGTRTSEQEVHYGFLGIENVREVETLIHKVLLGTVDDDDDDDD